jgi:hypothetical protein
MPITIADLHIPEHEMKALDQAYFINDAWLGDLELIAAAIDTNQPPSRIPATQPWALIAEQILSNVTMGDGITPAALRNAVTMAIGRAIEWRRNADKRSKMTSKLNALRAARVINPYLESPDEDLKARITTTLVDKETSALERKQIAEALLLDWLGAHGRFIRSAEGFIHYLYEKTHKLYDLESTAWDAWLHALTGVNPALTDYKVLLNATQSAAHNRGQEHSVVKLAHWDNAAKILRVTRFDGVTYVLTGTEICQENNGDGPVIFLDSPIWQAYDPDFDAGFEDFIAPFTRQTWGSTSQWAAAVWALSLFFTELCPTRPIAVFLGEKGSGKSMTLRMILRLLFGSMAELLATPDKPDDFLVSAYHNHVLALDNFDGFQEWMRDRLAGLATGIEMQMRTLYTNKELTPMKFRSWLAVTARQPDTLKRDDLADRLLIFKLERIKDEQRTREGYFLDAIAAMRNRWWGGMLNLLNQIVAYLRNNNLPDNSPLRMADWEVFGRAVSQMMGKTDEWKMIVAELKKAQGEFLAEDIIVEAIQKWLEIPTNINREVLARDLYAECEAVLFNGNKPDSDWPRSVKSFSHRLSNVAEYLKNEFGMKIRPDNRHGNWIQFVKA